MQINIRVFVLLCALLVSVSGTCVQAQNYQKTATGIKTTVHSIELELQFFNPSTVRVLKSPVKWSYDKSSLVVTAKPQTVKYSVAESGAELSVRTSAVTVNIDTRSGEISFFDKKGSPLLSETGASTFMPIDDAGAKSFKVSQSFRLDAGEQIYGLGIVQDGKMSKRGLHRHLIQSNLEDVSPVMQSVKGYGIYWDNYSPTDFVDTTAVTTFTSEVADCIDYYFVYGGDADGVIAQMRTLTGEVPMEPLWTYGFWQSRERYKSQTELLDVVHKYREQQIPLDGIIQDWQYWGDNYLWNAMEFNNPEFPKPQAMVDEVHQLHAHIMPSIWASFGPMTKPYRELNAKGLLLHFSTWPESGLGEWPPRKDYPSGVMPYDPYSSEARDIYWSNLTRLYNLGMDGWWMDSTEPDHMNYKDSDLDIHTSMGSFRKVRNAFPLMTVGGVYDHQRAAGTQKRVFILTRSGFTGQQRYGANVWSGDVTSSWDMFRRQVPAGLNFTLTANPNFNSDIGGFFCGAYNQGGTACNNPAFRELYVRWLQYGAFTPMMRSHGTDAPREIYQFGKKGEPVYDAIARMIRLRYALLPYIYSTSWQVSHRQGSFMRALVMDFRNDSSTWNIGNEYMFGKALLVAPVLHALYTSEKITKTDAMTGWNKTDGKGDAQSSTVDFTQPRTMQVYLPSGATWYDYWTGKTFTGGSNITADASLDVIPLYVRAGSIIPTGPDVQYSTEKPWTELTLHIYPGTDGTFTLYEDEFDNYNYERGAYAEIPITWNDKSRSLTLGARRGSYQGMLSSRHFIVMLPDGTQKTVAYKGKSVKVKF
jgi:alpha-D-xyloside xylohydrolase